MNNWIARFVCTRSVCLCEFGLNRACFVPINTESYTFSWRFVVRLVERRDKAVFSSSSDIETRRQNMMMWLMKKINRNENWYVGRGRTRSSRVQCVYIGEASGRLHCVRLNWKFRNSMMDDGGKTSWIRFSREKWKQFRRSHFKSHPNFKTLLLTR